MSKDYYKILGVERGASDGDIKKAFRRLANEHHPDRKGGDANKFKEVNEAYQVLSDAEKRTQYDQFGRVFEQGQGAGGFEGFSGFGQGVDFGNLEDLFGGIGDFFGGGGHRGARRQAKRGNDIEADVKIPFEESVFGVEKNLELKKPSLCEQCSGSGAATAGGIQSCTACGGKGSVQELRRTFLGSVATVVPCAACGGEGSIIRDRCRSCGGVGVTRALRKIRLRIPAGIEDGQMIRLAGMGEEVGRGGIPGDLYVRIHVQSHTRFHRVGMEIESTEALRFTQFVFGDSILVETIDGSVRLKIPAGTHPGQQFRLRGKGVPARRGGARGDHIVTTALQTPSSLSRQQKKILQELQTEGL